LLPKYENNQFELTVDKKSKVNKHRIVLMTASIAVICGLLSSTIIPFAFAQNARQGAIPPISSRYSQLAAAWWQWAVSIHTSNNPSNPFGSGTVDCSMNQPRQGNIWFLAGTAFPPFTGVVRTCNIPTGTSLFFPLLDAECDALTDPTKGVTDESKLRECVAAVINGVTLTSLTATVDGVPVSTDLRQFRVQSPLFTFTSVADSPFATPAQSTPLPAATSPSVADGYWVLLHPLPPGQHQISFGGSVSFPGGSFQTSVTYNIIVTPGRA
jgi:hypothetical protein